MNKFLSPIFSPLFVDAITLLASKATFIGLRLLLVYISASILNAEYFGAVTLSITIAEVVRYLIDWGSDTWALRQFSNPDIRTARVALRWMIKIRAIGSPLALTLTMTLIGAFTPLHTLTEQVIISLMSVTSLWLNLGVNWLQARQKIRATSGLFLTMGTVGVAYDAVAYHLALPFIYSLSICIAIEITLSLFIVRLIFQTVANIDHESLQTGDQAEDVAFSRWLVETSPIAIAVFISIAYGKFDLFYVSAIATKLESSTYLLAQRIVEPLVFTFVAFSSTLYTRASLFVYKNGAGKAFEEFAIPYLKKAAATSIAFIIVTVLAVHLAGSKISGKYPHLEVFTMIVSIAALFRIANQCLTAFIQANGAFQLMLKINGFFLLYYASVLTSLGYLLGVKGIAIGVAVGESTNTIVQFTVLRSRFFNKSKRAISLDRAQGI